MSDPKSMVIKEALALYQSKQFEAALKTLDDKSATIAGLAAFHTLRGLCLSELNEHDDAVKSFVEAVKINPLDPMPYANIGNSLAKNMQFTEANKYFDLALTVDPDHFESIVGKGVAAFQRLDYEMAESAFKRALAMRPGHIIVETNLGNCLSVQGKYDEALTLLNKAIQSDPENGLARTNRGLIHLVQGNFEQGWKDYEYRFDSGNMIPKRFPNLPRWKGPETSPENVLIWSEQGLGDEIMFSTIFRDLENLPHTFYIECDPRLLQIFKSSFQKLIFFSKGSMRNIDGVDSALPLASLGMYFRSSGRDFPKPKTGHLTPPPNSLSEKVIRLVNSFPRPIIGVSWQSYAMTTNFRGRKSIPTEEFSHLTRRLKGTVISLQFPNPHRHENPGQQEVPEGVIELEGLDLKNDISGIAELLSQLDRVISVGNTVAHICGGFGIPAEVFISRVPDWRWGSTSAESHWYKSLKLIRNNSDDWSDLLAKVL